MYHFFIRPEQVREDTVTILGDDVNHIRNVLRMKPGEEIGVSDGNRTWRCAVRGLDQDAVTAVILDERPGNELPCRIVLFQGVPKGDKLETVIQKSTELGVSEIVPVMMKRSIVKLDEKKQAGKQKRWQAIAESAAKQAGRDRIPEVRGVMDFEEALRAAASLDTFLLPYEHAEGMAQTRELFGSLDPHASIGILIGPEGGMEEDEVRRAAAAGAKIMTLGRRILRTETAGPAVLAMLTLCLEQR